MKIQVVTSWNNKLFKEYAHRFQSTYNWPFDLIVYNEDDDMFDKIPDDFHKSLEEESLLKLFSMIEIQKNYLCEKTEKLLRIVDF